jgi:DNA-directed RNA polymerase
MNDVNQRSDLTIDMKVDPELYQEQINLERRSYELGKERFEAAVQKRRDAGHEDKTSYGSRFIGHMVGDLAVALINLHEEISGKSQVGKPAVHALADAEIASIGFREAAMLTLQNIIASISQPTPYATVAVHIGKAIEDELFLASLKAEDDKLLKVIQRRIDQKNDPKHKMDSAVRIARMASVERDPWSEKKKLQTGQYLVEIATSLFASRFEVKDIAQPNKNGRQKVVKHIVATQEMIDWIANNVEQVAELTPVREPMCIPPVRWSHGMSHGGGYLSAYNRPVRMVKTRSRDYLEELKSAHMPEVIRALNAAQETPWRIRKHVVALHDKLREIGRTVTGSKMPELENVQVPEKPEWGKEHSAQRKLVYKWSEECKANPFNKPPKPPVHPEYEKREVIWNNYRKQAAMAFDENVSRKGQRVNFNLIMGTAKRFMDFESIYFPHQLDFRGRLYAVPNLNPQTADWIKGLLEFSEGRRLGPEGLWWFKVHVANLFGVDKVSFDERVAWTEKNWTILTACADDPIEVRLWEEADKPFQAYAACVEVRGIELEGADYVSHMPIDLDGSCSGLQNLGMALRCEITGAAVNLIPSDAPADIYSEVMDKVQAHMEETMGGAESREEALRKAAEYAKTYYLKTIKGADNRTWPAFLNKVMGDGKLNKGQREVKRELEYHMAYWEWLQFGLTRNHVKRSVMTFPYGSKEYGFREQVMEDTLGPLKKQRDNLLSKGYSEDKANRVFPFSGDGFMAAGAMARLLYKYVRDTVLKAAEIMEWMQKTAKLVAAQGRPVRWTTNLGFPVMQAYRQSKLRQINTRLFGSRMQLSIREEQENMDTVRAGNAISPNVTHSLDSSHLLKLVSMSVQEGMKSFALIHDSFGVHAADTGRFFQIIREAFVELYRNDYFGQLRDEFLAQLPPELREEVPSLPEHGRLDIESVIKSDYAFA